MEELQVVLAGHNNPTFAKMKKVDEDILNLGFSLQLRDGTSFDFISLSRSDFVNWTDGVRILLGGVLENTESQDEIEFLCAADISVKLLNLQGLEIPNEAPPVPPPPANFDFFYKDKDTGEQFA